MSRMATARGVPCAKAAFFGGADRLSCRRIARSRAPCRPHAQAKQSKTDEELETPEPGLLLKAAWVGAEQLGQLLGKSKGEESTSAAPAVKMTREQVIESLRDDYKADYFISGQGQMAAYDPQCLFADPFASFKGVERFKKNVSNLGGLLSDIRIDIYDWREDEAQVEARWRFSAIVELPWKPRLAAKGRTTHVISPESGLVVKHYEQWDTDPWKVIKTLLKPAAGRVPQSQSEVFFYSMSEGDVKGMWFSLSGTATKISLPIVVVSLVTKLATGEGLPGVWLGSIEGLAYLLLVGGAITEVLKFAQGMEGGGTGTGGRF